MEYAIEFGDDPQWVTITTSGLAHASDFRRLNDELVADSRFRPPMKLLVDHSDLDVSALTADEVQAIARGVTKLDPAFGQSKVAIVAPTSLAFGLARMFEALTSGSPVQLGVFAARPNALAWLRSSVLKSPS